ncbi:hypothetical protein NUACC26_015320 [Scytonema sp. NUACC26]
MTPISTKLVQQLRQKTSVGIMDCKKALQENNSDLIKAEEWLRKKGLAKAVAFAKRKLYPAYRKSLICRRAY